MTTRLEKVVIPGALESIDLVSSYKQQRSVLVVCMIVGVCRVTICEISVLHREKVCDVTTYV